MAQDFGDDVGERLFRAIGRYTSYFIRDWMREKEYQRRLDERLAEKEAEQVAAPQPEEVYMPLGNESDAAYFAKVCQENDIEVAAFADAEGNGYVRFASDDLERVQTCTQQFAEVMTQVNADRIAEQLESAEPLTEKQIADLSEVTELPDLPQRKAQMREVHVRDAAQPSLGGEAAAAREAAGEVSHTRDIADKVLDARERCTTFDDFKEILAKDGIGVTTTKDGESMFYEARRGENGELLPYSREARDWAVGADTLKERYDVDATHDWFEKNTPKDPGGAPGPGVGAMVPEPRKQPEQLRVGPRTQNEPQVTDGSLDMDGRTPDLNQGIDSHDGMDTDTRTLRVEREQNGTDVAPSMVREEAERSRVDSHDDRRGYSLDSEARECRAASKQLETESGHTEHELDISDKMSQVR